MGAEAEAKVPAEVPRALFAHAGAALGGRGAASAACVSRAWRAAAGAHGVLRAALGSEDADERVRGCKVVATAAAASRAGARADERQGDKAVDAAAAEKKKGTFDALLEALLRDGDVRVRREAVRALWVLSGGNVAPARAKAIAAALDGEALFTIRGHGGPVKSVCFSPDGRQVASGSEDCTVRLWDVETGSCVKTLGGGPQGYNVNSVCFSPDGRRLASGSEDWTVRLWDVETGACVKALEGHRGEVNSVCFSPDGRQLASGSDDRSLLSSLPQEHRTVRLWDVETGACVKALEGHRHGVNSVCFSPDGQQLASGSSDWTVRLWDGVTGACVKTLEGHGNRVNSVCFSPDGQQLASGGDNRMVRLWDGVTGACVKTLEGHGNLVLSVCFSPNGRMVASGSSDRKVRLWLLV